MSRRKSSAPSQADHVDAQPASSAGASDDMLDRTNAVLASHPDEARLIRYVRGLPHVLTEWHSDPKYLDANDEPRELRLHARGPSLARLIRRVLPDDDVESAAEALVRWKAVKKSGELYTAISRRVSLARDPQALRAHSIAALRGHIAAIQHNASFEDANRRVLELEASNLRIPTRLLPEIHRDIFKECGPALTAVDNYLQSQEVVAGSEPTTCVGVSFVAYEDPWVSGADGHAKPVARAEVASDNVSPALPPDQLESLQATIQSFVRILTRLRVGESEFVELTRNAYRALAQDPPSPRMDVDPEIPAASHVLTVWKDDPTYTREGKPRPLRLAGPAPSFRSLVASVDPQLDPEEVIRYLTRTGNVERRGEHYHAIKHAVIVRGVEGPALEQTMRRIRMVLGTLENNLRPASVAPPLIERMAENATVPNQSPGRLDGVSRETWDGFSGSGGRGTQTLRARTTPG